jgi:hypothetical protein
MNKVGKIKATIKPIIIKICRNEFALALASLSMKTSGNNAVWFIENIVYINSKTIITIKKYKKLEISFVIPIIRGGVYNKIIMNPRGIKETIIHGIRRPHFVCVRSESPPNKGSFNPFQIDQIINPIETNTTLILTIV